MKGALISPKMRERHIVCNILLGVFFTPLVIIDLIGMIICLIDFHSISIIIGLLGLLALIGVYGVLLRNKWNGLFLGVLALFTACTSFIAYDNYQMAFGGSFYGISKVQAIMDALPMSFIVTFFCVLPIFMVLLISKNGKSAMAILEGGGIITKAGIEIIFAILMSCIAIATSC